MRRFIILLACLFSITMALVIGLRMSPDAMAVIIGIICGVLASIPTSMIMIWILRQRDRQAENQYSGVRPSHYPPVVVVNGHGQNGYGNPVPPALTAAASPPGSRDFKVIGQENTETTGDLLPSFWE